MKLTVPPLELGEFEGFSSKKDIFQRKPFGEELTNLIINVNDELVIALDAPWGEGKTTFVKMWRGLLDEKGFKSIYFDAFSNDFIEDPQLALTGEVYGLIDKDNKELKRKFLNKAVSTLKIIGRAGLRIGIRAATSGLVDDSLFKGAGAEHEFAEITDKYIASRLEDFEKDKNSINEFKQLLQDIAINSGDNKPLVFIIDELDRCKPSFALDLLEKIKHVFLVQGLVFILVMNREQLEQIIKLRYGDVKTDRYLQKFISLWAELPKNKRHEASDCRKYVRHCLSRMEFGSKKHHQAQEYLESLIEYYGLSLREIERTLTNYAIIHNLTNGNLKTAYLWVLTYLSIIKVRYPDYYLLIRNKKINYKEILVATELEALTGDWWIEKPEKHQLKWLLRLNLSDVKDIQEMLEQGDFTTPQERDGEAVARICQWFETFSR